jgi:ferrous iron transport protein A
MKLIEVPLGERARLISVEDVSLRAKLIQYGLYPGDSLRVLRLAPFGGPVLIEVNDREIALGRALAKKILVEIQ